MIALLGGSLRATHATSASKLAGDFNINFAELQGGGVPPTPEDKPWQDRAAKDASWRSVNTPCVYAGSEQRHTAFSGDKMQLVQIPRTSKKARPIAYLYDPASPTSLDPRSTLEPVHISPVVHGLHGILYKMSP